MKYDYRLSTRQDKKRIISFVKEFLDVNETAESIFWERLRKHEIEGKIVNKPSKKGNSFFLQKVIRVPVLIILVIYLTVNSLAAPFPALKI